MRRVRHIPPSQVVAPPRVASLAELVTKLNALSQNVRSMTATVDLEPTTGSIYSGVIKEYHDVRGFILIQSPSMIRVLGQAPVVRTDIFDMVSNGEEYRLYIPPVQQVLRREDGLPASRQELTGKPAAPTHSGSLAGPGS